MPSRKVANVFRYAMVVCALAGGIYSLVRGRAHLLFQQDTAASVPAAVRLVPYDAAYLARLAAWRPAEKVALLKRAVKLNPFDFESLIQLGFVSEFQEHDDAAAERLYLRAAGVNQMYLPRWTLTNFYFRHSRQRDFFRWAYLTLAVTPFAPEPIFVQMWLLSQDPAQIARAIPARPRILLPYAWFLSNNRQYAAIPPIVERLVADVGKANPRAWGRDDLLAAIEDRLVAADETSPALHIWGTLSRARWLPEGTPTTDAPLTNGSFQAPLYPHGFGWTTLHIEGAYLDQMFDPSGLRLRLTGDQPENCVLLQRYLPLAAGHIYNVSWKAELQSLGNPSGLTWHLRPIAALLSSSVSSPDLASARSWQVPAPAPAGLSLLTLEYHRPLGEARARGTLLLRSVDMMVLPKSTAEDLH